MKKLLVSLLLLVAGMCYSQINTQTEEKPYIEVTGTAEKEIVPDIIYISITLKDKVVNRGNYIIAAQEDKLMAALRSLNIDLKKLSLSDASTGAIIQKQKEKGIEEKKQFLLEVNNAQQVSKVFEALHAIEIKEANIAGTSHTQIEAYRKEVRISAVKAAKEKAIYLLQAVSEEPGKPLVIKELTDSVRYATNSVRNNYSFEGSAGESDSGESSAEFRKMKIKFSYYAKYLIK